MTPEQFWQNFKLGEEQEIAGNFIYDGLSNLHRMETLSYETEIFPVLYNLSVGLERLLKVAVVLLEFDDSTQVDSFEKSLITHNHLDLLNRIKGKKQMLLGDVHIELLNMLSVFYKTHRYDRFSLQSLTHYSKDKKAFHEYLSKHLKINIDDSAPLFAVENTLQIKKFVGKTVKRIAREVCSVIQEAARLKNLYTEEISSSSSKAAKIFLGDDDATFVDEDIVMIEILIFLMKTKKSSLVDFMKDIEPLSLDPALDREYLQALLHRRPSEVQGVVDEVESCYVDVVDPKERLEIINVIKDPGIYLG